MLCQAAAVGTMVSFSVIEAKEAGGKKSQNIFLFEQIRLAPFKLFFFFCSLLTQDTCWVQQSNLICSHGLSMNTG